MSTDQGELERYTYPPQGATTAQERGLSKWETTLTREEIENWEGIFGEPYHKPPFRGASEPALDMVFENPERVSPEAVVLFDEFMRERRLKPRAGGGDLKQEFLSWLSEDVRNEVKTAKPKGDHFTPTEIVLDPNSVSFDVVDFKELWSNTETKVIYRYHPGGKGGNLVFEGKVNGKPVKIEVKIGELTRAAFGREIFFGTPHGEEDKQEFWNKLKSLRVDDKPLAADKIDFRYPIYLFLKKDVLGRKFSHQDRTKVLKFNRLWREGKPFKSIGFGFRNGAILGIALEHGVGAKREVAQLPFDLFRAAYGVVRFDGRENGRRAEGANFGEMATLSPATPCENFIGIVSSISIDRAKLPPKTRIIASDFSGKRKPVGVTIGYT